MTLSGAFRADQQTTSGYSRSMEPGDILYDIVNGNIFIISSVMLDSAAGHYNFRLSATSRG